MTENILSGGRVISRSFFIDVNGFSERIIYKKVGGFKLKSVSRYFKNEKNAKFMNKGAKGDSIWDFIYNDGKVVSAFIFERDANTGETVKRELVFSYNKDGGLKAIDCLYGDGISQAIYKN